MNMQNLMAQAQKMQREITKAKEEIDERLFSSKTQLVSITMNGKKIIQSIKIDRNNEISNDDLDAIEDMILIAINNCMKDIDKATEEKLGKYGQALNGMI